MAYKKLKRIYDKEVLSKRAEEINMLKNKKAYKLVTTIVGRLKEVLRKSDDLIVLSAPQINYPYRIFCIKFSDGDIRGFVNPLIYKYSEETHLSREIQLSHDNETEYIIPRFDSIEMSFQTPVGNLESNLFEGTLSEVIQQVNDLLDGVFLEDYGFEVIEGFDEASAEDKEEMIRMYIEHLNQQNEDLKELIEQDEANIKANEAIQFMEQAKLGNVEIQMQPKEEETSQEEAKEA